MTEGAIAIVGASCRFPGAAGLDAFWRLIIDGVDAVSEVGPDRWSKRFFYHPASAEPGKTYSWAAGLIDSIDEFEPEFFGISPREAVEMDPQQRLLLELAWHALEDAGIPASRLAGTQTGVFIGASSTDYGDMRLGDPAGAGPHFLSGSTLSILANRLSHVFDLRGPSQVIDTACSSSLVALHVACEALRSGKLEAALVGGVNLLLSPYPFIGFAQAGMLSRRGRCFAFDARADGYVRGEGGAVVALKPLARALADSDLIRGVIRGTAVNASGRTIGLSLPSATAQADLLRRVYAEAGVAPDVLGFVEMHGTGTPAGDPVEAAAVGRVLGQARQAALPIGSVKTNIGHLEPASGMAGLLKAMLALEHGGLPRSLYGETPNPAIPFDWLNLRLVGADEAIGPNACAGVNSFGFGGSNAHAILAPPPAREGAGNIEAVPTPLMISARGEDALRALVRQWRDTIAATPPQRWPPIMRAAARRRDHHQRRLVVLGDDPAAALTDFLADRSNPAAVVGSAAREGRLAFVYSGNGAQFPGMGQEAYRASAAFRDAIAEVDRTLQPHLGWSVKERIAGDIVEEEIRRADIAQPMLFAIQVAITSVLRSLGVMPAGFVGHSVGEIAAAWGSGALSLEDASRVVVIRSLQQERTRGAGRMAVLSASTDEAAALLGEIGGGLEIAAINGTRSVTIAGSASTISRLGAEAARRNLAWRLLDLDFAFHSAAMERLRDDLIAELGDMSSGATIGNLVSTVTGAHVLPGALDARYWWRNIRDPVRFAEAIEALIADGHRIFVEIGPNPILLSYLREALRAAEPAGNALATFDRRDAPGDPFPAIAARLHVAGHDMSRAPWLDGPDEPRGLPLYPWQRQRFWFGRTVEAAEQANPICDHPLLGFRQPGAVPGWVNQLDTALFPFLTDHRVEGTPILPGAVVIEMALAAARTRYPDASALELRDIEIVRPVMFDNGARETRCMLLPDGAWRLDSRKRLADEAVTEHAKANVVVAAPGRRQRLRLSGDVRDVVSAETLYRLAARLGLDYGDGFRTVEEVRLIDDGRAVVKLRSVSIGQDWLLDPSTVDGAFQGLLALLRHCVSSETGFLPRRFGRVTAIAPFCRAVTHAELRLTHHGARSAGADIALYDAAGEAVAELSDCWFARARLRTGAELLLHTVLVPAPLEPQAPAIFDRLSEIVACAAAAQRRDPARETEQALLFEALLGAIARETNDRDLVPEALRALARRFAELELPPSGELWRSLLADHPEMTTELALAAALREGQTIDEASPIVAALLLGSPSAVVGRAVLATTLDEIAAAWPRDRPLRVYEPGTGSLLDRLRGAGIAAISADKDTLCDLALLIDPVEADVSRVNLAPGAVLLAVTPHPSPLWGLLDHQTVGRGEVMAAGFGDCGSVPISGGPLPREVLWARAPEAASASAPPAARSLGVIADAADGGFVSELDALGHRLTSPDAAGDGIIVVAAGGDPVAATHRLIPCFTRAAATAAERRVPLWLVTNGAQQGGGDAGLCGAALWSFGRVLRNETPGLVLRMVDLPVGMSTPDRARCFAAELTAGSTESEIVWTPSGRHVPRLRRGLPPVWAQPDEAIAAAVARPGRPDRFEWAPVPRGAPRPGEIAIDVHAAGLNFRDVMAASGMLPEGAMLDGFAGASLGLECAGVVSAVGAGIGTIAVGDRVVGFAPAALASRVVTRADAVIPMSPNIDFAAAATLPVAFVTARYALLTLARLQPGEAVLIHAASGGVGLAAIQTAKACGATVIATAGSPAKRAFLRAIGADHVCDSRELHFVAAVREATAGAGVDVVLNSLSGAAMEVSLELLKPFGRFVELGKRDFYENRMFRSRLLRQNISYFAVDVDQLPARRPALAKALLGEIADALAAGEIRPLAHRCLTFAEIGDAFRLMQAAQHIGKLVLVPDRNAGVAISRPADFELCRDAAYVVTGGLAGFGFAAARWLAERGAGHLALVGRRGAGTPAAAARIAELEALGVTVSVHAADVADPDMLADAFDTLRGRGAPIRGVVHAAAEIVDGTAATLSPDDIATALRAKVAGALNLDRLTRDDPLDLFWLFSSATSFVGAPGQGAYVAANAMLEALARRRHAEGLPALAIAWGPIADFGALADQPDGRDALSRRLGVRPMAATRALAALPAMVASGLPVVAVADFAGHGAALPTLTDPLFDELRTNAADVAADEALLDRLAGLDAAGKRDLLASVIANEAAHILRYREGRIDLHRPLAELGMDSLMAIELRLALEARLRVDIPLMSLAEGASAAALAARLSDMITQFGQRAAVVDLAARHETTRHGFDRAADE